MRDYPSAVASSPSEARSAVQGQTSGSVDPIGEAPKLEELLVHGILVAEQVKAYPPEDSLVDRPKHRQVDLAIRSPEYIQ